MREQPSEDSLAHQRQIQESNIHVLARFHLMQLETIPVKTLMLQHGNITNAKSGMKRR